VVAFLLSYAAHHEWGLSGVPVRTGALLAALLIAKLVAIEFFGKSLRKPKLKERLRAVFLFARPARWIHRTSNSARGQAMVEKGSVSVRPLTLTAENFPTTP
jgi:hypothetical protein